MSRRRNGLEWTKRIIGLDRAVLFTLSARIVQIFSSIGTVLLIVRYLSPIAQGYYYTLLSLAALQTIFELGFSFVILQLAAHETAHLEIFPDGRIEGDPVAHERLASVLQLTIRWYVRAAFALATVLLPLGAAFFARKHESAVQVSWIGPWITAVLGVSFYLFLTPLYSFLEGCKQVQQVARVRMFQALAALAMSWSAIATGHGLYACALVNLGAISVGVLFLWTRRGILLPLLRYPVGDRAVSWRREIWPFQWRIAVSWLCSYFTLQIFTPILFVCRGPQEAGRMGLSLSITGYLPIVALCWIATKAVPFGQLVQLGRLPELDALFSRTLKQSLALIVALAAACFAAVLALQRISPPIALRMERPRIFVLLLATAICAFIVQALAIYLRSFKREPYLAQSVAVAALTLAGAWFAAPRWGGAAIAAIYFLFGGVLALSWATATFCERRRFQIEDKSRATESRASLPEAEGVPGASLHAIALGRGAE
jgi:hypothetical protein